MTVMLDRPTPMETPDGPPDFEALCRTLLSMEVPDGHPPFGCELDTSGFGAPAEPEAGQPEAN